MRNWKIIIIVKKWITRDLEGTDEDIEKRIKAKRESLRKSTTTRCIECEKEEAQQKAKSEYEKRKNYVNSYFIRWNCIGYKCYCIYDNKN